MIEQTFRNIGAVEPLDARLVYIKNTKELETIFISEALLKEAKAKPELEVFNNPYEFQFNEENDMIVPML